MKKLIRLFLILAFVPAFVLTSCKKDDENTFDAQKALTKYLVANNLDINTIIGGFVFSAPADGDVSGKYVIDVRTADEFAAGHIVNAHRVDLKDILTEAAKADKPILIVCKSGQTATHAVAILRLSGYADAQALKWGMSGWNSSLDIWTSNLGNIAADHANWNTAAAPTNLTYESPKFSSADTIPANILKARIAAVLEEGFKSVQPADVLANPGNYFINNYFSETDYAGFGHVAGAYRINPLLVGEGQVNYLDPSKEILTYCYTGQTSAAITAYLRVLGYNAKSIMWGMNKFHNASTAWGTSPNQWKASMSKNLPIVTGN
ncbi:MAG TPA: rhodanese-like domain-containing protein [Lentimicrobium sp.]|jgi:rhodanese-related sulfurtransferase|nr:rhodanese-like domain-containing protein [Lentimicrobium sp.]